MRNLSMLIAFLLSVLVQPVYAIHENAGTTGFNFLKVGIGARGAALGGAFAAVPGDIETPFWNPAGLQGVAQQTMALSLSRYLVDTQAGFFSVARPAAGKTWAFNLSYFSYGDMRRTSADGQDLGAFEASDMAAYLTLAQPWLRDWLAVGVNLKAVYSTIDSYSADAYMVDLGLLAHGPLDGMTIGASLSNLGAVRSGYVGNFKDSLPVLLRLGVSHRPAHMPVPMLLVAELNVPNDNDPYLAFGIEVLLAGGLYLRPGYSAQQTGMEGKERVGLTAGLGVTAQRYRLDYAFASYAGLGDVHRVSLSRGF
jgi:hypothetical protein